jgi:hypothetical protein
MNGWVIAVRTKACFRSRVANLDEKVMRSTEWTVRDSGQCIVWFELEVFEGRRVATGGPRFSKGYNIIERPVTGLMKRQM